ncbi:DUF5071 domain-containing protein [Paenibacillus sp. SC116]|uniref:DUF5071 domain-containing protein n=1 Tax=Paenibacillus sp. SC116 TaxID=2968986 RepID=UPI00215AF749|nr:DUF5071 domain-containing protein [Paenibacillus sp. SC116]MCR8845649.1 DUF5071 domain-containing protein [Paenibacillus sp. SC116]
MNNLLPRDKQDFERVNNLKLTGKKELIALLAGLLEWLQDMNWPISIEVSELLVQKTPIETIPFVKNVLNSDDDIWKANCLRYFVMKLPSELLEIDNLHKDLIRIATRPTMGEELEEVHLTALEIIEAHHIR